MNKNPEKPTNINDLMAFCFNPRLIRERFNATEHINEVTEIIQTKGSLDCCTKKEIKENNKNVTCSICHNTGYLLPKGKKK